MHRPLRIVQVDAETGFSGGEVQVFLLLEGLRARGHEAVLVCPPGSRAEAEAARRDIPSRPASIRNHVDLLTVHRLRRTFRDLDADLVHTNTGRDAWLAGFAAWRGKFPSVTTRRMDRRVKRGPRTRLTYGRFADRVAAISPGVRACLVDGGIDPGRIVLIPEAVDPDRVRPRHARDEVRAGLGVGGSDVLLLGLGALVERKGFDVVLEALGALEPSARRRVALRIGGEGEARSALVARTRALGLESTVAFLGAREDVGDLLAAADVFVMPSRREGLGVAALEAMGAGLPVVASRVGGLAFSVVDGETGLLVEPDDAPSLATALGRLVGDEALRQRLGQGARARVDERFRPDAMVEAYLALYREVLAGRE
ncbi:MAG: glycosyltransferase family 4 protein [Planctomycetota bacterium]